VYKAAGAKMAQELKIAADVHDQQRADALRAQAIAAYNATIAAAEKEKARQFEYYKVNAGKMPNASAPELTEMSKTQAQGGVPADTGLRTTAGKGGGTATAAQQTAQAENATRATRAWADWREGQGRVSDPSPSEVSKGAALWDAAARTLASGRGGAVTEAGLKHAEQELGPRPGGWGAWTDLFGGSRATANATADATAARGQTLKNAMGGVGDLPPSFEAPQ
jgi:hypothetical protein